MSESVNSAAMEKEQLETLKTYFDMAWPMASGILLGLVIFIAGWIVAGWAKKIALSAAQRAKLDEALARFLSSIARYTVLAATVIAALEELGVKTTSLVAVLASAGLAVGLALQGSLSNFASGVLILFFRPINLEDFVTAGGATGTVKDIGLFTTTVITLDNEKVIIPNSAITAANVQNFTVLGKRRAKISIGVAYGEDMDKALEVLLGAAQRADLVLPDPEPAVAFVGFGASSLDFLVLTYATPENWIAMQHNVRKAIYEDLNKAGIEIPFNQIVVHRAEAAA